MSDLPTQPTNPNPPNPSTPSIPSYPQTLVATPTPISQTTPNQIPPPLVSSLPTPPYSPISTPSPPPLATSYELLATTPLAPNPLLSFATKFNINSAKPFFPVNTLRLLYLIIADGLTDSNTEIVTKVNQIISKINAVIDTRNQALEDNQQTNPMLEIQSSQNAINEVLELVNTPVIHHTFDLLFSDLYPLQENLLLALDKHLNEKTLSIQDLFSILKIRAMDSVVYSTIIHQVILKHSPQIEHTTYTQVSPIHWQVNLTMQINDLVDSIIHAKEDLENQSAPLINILKRILTNSNEVELVVNNILDTLVSQSAKLPFPQPLQGHIKTFNQQLIATLTATRP
jgi:hypothetical protein